MDNFIIPSSMSILTTYLGMEIKETWTFTTEFIHSNDSVHLMFFYASYKKRVHKEFI